MSTRLIALTLVCTVLSMLVPLPAAAVTTVPQAAPRPMPKPTEVLLDVAAHNAAWIVSIRGDLLTLTQAYAALNKISVAMPVKLQMMLALRHGGWIITTTHPVTSQGWTGTPWIVVTGPAKGLYLNTQHYTNFSAGDHTGITTNGDDSSPGLQLAKDITAFGKAVAELGLALAATGKGIPGPAGKAATALGVGLAALGLAIASVGLQDEAAILGGPKQGHVDSDTDPPEGIPSITIPDLGQGGSGIGPAGPDGSAPSGPGPSGGGGSTGDSGVGDE